MGLMGKVYLVGAGPGDAGLLTMRGAELLRRADVVVYDALVNRELLALAPEAAEGHLRRQTSPRPSHPAGGVEPVARRESPGRQDGRAAQGRRPVHFWTGRRGGSRAETGRRAVRGRAGYLVHHRRAELRRHSADPPRALLELHRHHRPRGSRQGRKRAGLGTHRPRAGHEGVPDGSRAHRQNRRRPRGQRPARQHAGGDGFAGAR